MAQLRIGISGWRYPPWRGKFYPADLPQRCELEYASHKLNSIEINGTFYSLQRPQSFAAWHDTTPEDFVFAVKGARFITHMKKLKDVQTPLANFFASGVLRLGHKLGPILWQFPQGFAFNEQRFEEFFLLLPRSTQEAAQLARKHDKRLAGRSWMRLKKSHRLRHAVEIRHPSFRDARFIELLRRYNVALVFADTAGKWPYMEDVTSDFVYVRLHGDKELYTSGYTDSARDWWVRRMADWQRGSEPSDSMRIGPKAKLRKSGRDIYAYFDNDVKVRAPVDAMNLARKLTS